MNFIISTFWYLWAVRALMIMATFGFFQVLEATKKEHALTLRMIKEKIISTE